MNAPAAPRVCVYGAAPAASWRDALARDLPSSTTIEAFDATHPVQALAQAAQRFPGDDLILLSGGVVLPPFWHARLLHGWRSDGVLVASPLHDAPAASPLMPGIGIDDAARIDALCHLHARHAALDWTDFCAALSLWNGTLLREANIAQWQHDMAPAASVGSCVLLDHVYVAGPSAHRAAKRLDAPAARGAPPSALGELREAIAADLQHAALPPAYPGVDGKPVLLHVLHGWGGGAQRYVHDLARADAARHHLVLIARGSFARRCYGERLELCHALAPRRVLRAAGLSAPIESTALAHRGYREFLDAACMDFGVAAIMLSSLIGHSLDALRTGLPTTCVVHDFYPGWPILHRDMEARELRFDARDLAADLAASGADFEFAQRDAGFWQTLRDAFVAALLQSRARLVAPSQAALDIVLRMQPRLRELPAQVIAHGLPDWPGGRHVLPDPPARERLRLVVLGRVRDGKAARLLHQALPGLLEHAELFLLGAGNEGHAFFGIGGVHVVLDYDNARLPQLLAAIAPDAALLPASIPETFSYTLSELRSLALPVIATRLGAPAQRIRDGVDGFLVAPEPHALVARVADLARARDELRGARAALAALPVRGMDEMLADYAALLPAGATPDAPVLLRRADGAAVRAAQHAAQLGDARRELAAQARELEAQQQELARRADWGQRLDTELARSRARFAQLQETERRVQVHLQAAQARLRSTQAEADRVAALLVALQGEFADRTRWAQALDAELAAMRASTSWRITGPLRYLKRRARAIKVRLRYLLDRLRANVHRTRGSLASRGVTGTIRRAAEEFRRATPIAPLAVAAPDEAFAPFNVPRADTPKVSIVIPVFNKIAYTVACLRSLAEHASSVAFETIVVDDASSDATAERLAQVEGVRTVRNARNLGFVGSCNAGAQAAQGEYLVFLNNDTVVTAGWLDALIACFEEQPDCGLAGAKLVYPDGRLQEAGGIVFNDASGWNYGRFEDPEDPRFNFRRESDYCSGAAIMLRRDFFESLGRFDTRYAPAYYEDTDLAFAVRAAGRHVYFEPRAVVVHFEGVSAGTDTGSGMKRFQAINREKFALKWQDVLARQPAPIHDAARAEVTANFRARGHVLIVDAYTPTPDQDSGSLRMLNIMRLLRESNCRVSFLPDNHAHAGGYTRALQALGVEALFHPFVSDPVAWLREHGASLHAVILSRHYVAAKYVGAVRLYAPQARLIFDTVDVHHLREARAAELEGSAELAQHAARTRAQELKLMRDSDITLVVSDAERALLASQLPGVRIDVLSNVHDVPGRRKDFDARRDLVFVGGFQHPPNIDAVLWFVNEVFPRVRAELHDVRFHVIGSKAPRQILDLAHDGVTVHGFVEDITPFMDDSRLSIAPLRYGAGVKGKINMAMSYGLPVVATTPAAEGMHARNGIDLLVADSPEDFAAAIVRAYGDAALWNTLSDNGLANVREHFSFDAARKALVRILPTRESVFDLARHSRESRIPS